MTNPIPNNAVWRWIGTYTGLQLIAALALSWVPLYQDFGFERALATGLWTSLLSPMLGWALASASGPKLQSYATGLAIGLLNLGWSAGFGLWVESQKQFCRPSQGLLWLLLLAGGNLALGLSLGFCVSRLAKLRASGLPGFLPWLLPPLVWVASLGAILWGLYQNPQISVYSAWFGYWPGSIYDENLAIHPALLGSRLFGLALAALGLSLSQIGHNLGFWRWRQPSKLPWSLFLSLMACLGLWLLGPSQGWRQDRRSLVRIMPERLRAPGIRIHAEPSLPEAGLLALLEAVQTDMRELEAFFGAPPQGRFTIFVYPNARRKGELIGGQYTQLARPWQREIHINGLRLPHPVLKHELAHLFAADYAGGPLKLPSRFGILPEMGLIEGLAVAADWPKDPKGLQNPTRLSAAMQRLGLLPKLDRLLSLWGFWSESSSRAYTAAGAWMHDLGDHFGQAALLRFYRDGDAEAAFGQPLARLIQDWEARLASMPLSELELAEARRRFEPGSVFERSCPHEAARLRSLAWRALQKGALPEAKAHFEALSRFIKGDPGPHLALARAYRKAGQFEAAWAELRAAGAIPKLPQNLKQRLREANTQLLDAIQNSSLPASDKRRFHARKAELDPRPD